MTTVQVRDVPDEVATAVAVKAQAQDKSVSAYLRDLMAADVKEELQRRAIEQWNRKLKTTHTKLGIKSTNTTDSSTRGMAKISSAEVVREIREEHERGDA